MREISVFWSLFPFILSVWGQESHYHIYPLILFHLSWTVFLLKTSGYMLFGYREYQSYEQREFLVFASMKRTQVSNSLVYLEQFILSKFHYRLGIDSTKAICSPISITTRQCWRWGKKGNTVWDVRGGRICELLETQQRLWLCQLRYLLERKMCLFWG